MGVAVIVAGLAVLAAGVAEAQPLDAAAMAKKYAEPAQVYQTRYDVDGRLQKTALRSATSSSRASKRSRSKGTWSSAVSPTARSTRHE